MAAGAPFRDAMLAAVAVLIVTCPCALGLAAPMAQAVASGALFRRGVMLKDGGALERLAKADHAVFDKTGVLTHGALSVSDAGGLDGAALHRAASLASRSTHPLARALSRYGEARGLAPKPASDLYEEAGQGVSGIVDGVSARLGSAAWCGAEPSADAHAESECWYREEGGATLRLRFADTLRGNAAGTVAALRDAGLETQVLSGDRPAAVARIAEQTGIGRFEAGLRPEEKIARVEALQAAGHTVLMVGDGINDAPALAAASVSMAPASASDVGRAAADLVFTGEDLGAVASAWRLARRTRAVILQNFALAAGYNVIAIPLAVAGLAGPLVAAIAMSSSSLLVTANALRLGRAGER